MKLPLIGIFCKGNIPTVEEQKLIMGLSAYKLVILNVTNIDEREHFTFDGVAGAVPERFSHFPTAEEAVKTYSAELAKLYALADGQPPVPPSKDLQLPPDPPNGDDPPKDENDGDKKDDSQKLPPVPPKGFTK